MNPLHTFFPETDGLSEALQRQSRAISWQRVRNEERVADDEPADWDAKRGFERGDHGIPTRFLDTGESLPRITEADCRQTKPAVNPQDAVSFRPGDPPMGTLAELADADSDASGDALIGVKQEERWHTEPPTVAGVYVTRIDRDRHPFTAPEVGHLRHWNGANWSFQMADAGQDGAAMSRNTGFQRQWLRLIRPDQPAKPPLKWLPCPAEGLSVLGGMLIFRRDHGSGPARARPASACIRWDEYLPAAPGVKEGDPFDASLYEEVKE